jgi:hypothetical protein
LLLFPGPAAALTSVRLCERKEWWLDDCWAEGGALLDLDHCVLIFWGGEDLMYEPGLRRVFMKLIKTTWPGWRVQWATEGPVTIVEYLKMDPRLVISSPPSSLPTAAASPWEIKGNKVAWTLVTLRDQQGEVKDFRIQSFCMFLLAQGPTKLGDLLRSRPPGPLPNESEWGREALFIDVSNRTVWACGGGEFFGGFGTVDRRCVQAIEHRWSGWKAHVHSEGIAYHVELSGRNPTVVHLPIHVALHRLARLLISPMRHVGPDPLSIQQKHDLFHSAVSSCFPDALKGNP